MRKLIEIEKQTDNQYLNMYIAVYKVDGKKLRYQFASRRSEEELAIMTEGTRADAVRVVPYYFEDGKMKVVLIREFRYPINKYIFAVPAGLIDAGEDEETAVKREVGEEIGAKVVHLVKTDEASYASAGMCDEALSCFEAEVELLNNQQLEETEDISVVVVDLDDLPLLLDHEEFGLQSRLQLRAFYYKHRRNV